MAVSLCETARFSVWEIVFMSECMCLCVGVYVSESMCSSRGAHCLTLNLAQSKWQVFYDLQS